MPIYAGVVVRNEEGAKPRLLRDMPIMVMADTKMQAAIQVARIAETANTADEEYDPKRDTVMISDTSYSA